MTKKFISIDLLSFRPTIVLKHCQENYKQLEVFSEKANNIQFDWMKN